MTALMDTLRDLAPIIASRADEIEKARRLPSDLAGRLAASGAFRMLVPKAYGGLEVSPREHVEALELLGGADASVGWCVMIAATSGVTSAYLTPAAARLIYGNPLGITGGVFAPLGQATVDGDSYLVNGTWHWASGSANCHWLMGGCVVMEDGKPLRRPDGMPETRMMLFPADQATLTDTWHVMGLCGTGSGQMDVSGVRVSREHSVSLMVDSPVAEGRLYAFPVFGLLAVSIAAVMLGNAKAALQDAMMALQRKSPQAKGRSAIERGSVQMKLAETAAHLRSARAYLLETLDAAWETAKSQGTLSLEERADLRLAATHAVRTASAVVTAAYELGGGAAVYASNPLQRRLRDAHVGTQHMMVAPPTFELAGRVMAGLQTDIQQL